MEDQSSGVVEIVLKHGDGRSEVFHPTGEVRATGSSQPIMSLSTPASYISTGELAEISKAFAEDVLPDAPSYDTSAVLDAIIQGRGAEFRKQLTVTQDELALVLGVNQSVVSRVEADPDKASLGTLRRIAAAIVEAARRKPRQSP